MGTMRLRSFQSRYAPRSAPAVATTDLKSVPAGPKSLRGFTAQAPFLIEILGLQKHLESHGDHVGQLLENFIRQEWKVATEGVQIGTADGHQGDRAASPGRGPVNRICSHDRQLFQGGRRLQRDKGHFFPIPSSSHDLNDAASHDVHRCAGFPLFKDVLAVPVGPFVEDPSEPSEVPLREVLEERHLLEEVHEAPASLSCRRFRMRAVQRTRRTWGVRVLVPCEQNFLHAGDRELLLHHKIPFAFSVNYNPIEKQIEPKWAPPLWPSNSRVRKTSVKLSR